MRMYQRTYSKERGEDPGILLKEYSVLDLCLLMDCTHTGMMFNKPPEPEIGLMLGRPDLNMVESMYEFPRGYIELEAVIAGLDPELKKELQFMPWVEGTVSETDYVGRITATVYGLATDGYQEQKALEILTKNGLELVQIVAENPTTTLQREMKKLVQEKREIWR